MNPAALKMNVADLKTNGILIVNTDNFKEADLKKAQMTSNPLEDHTLDAYRVFAVELTKLTARRAQGAGPGREVHGPLQDFFSWAWRHPRP